MKAARGEVKHEKSTTFEAPPLSRRPVWIKPAGLVAADIVAGLVAFLISLFAVGAVRDTLGLNTLGWAAPSFKAHMLTVATLTTVMLVWFRSKGHYTKHQALADQIGAVFTAALTAMLTSAAIQFATVEVGSRLLTGLYWVLLIPGVLASRLAVRTILKASKLWCAPAALFTSSDRTHGLAVFLRKRREIGFDVTHTLVLDDLPAEDIAEAMGEARERGLEIIYAPSAQDTGKNKVIRHLVIRGIPFTLAPDLGPVPHRARVVAFPPEDINLVTIEDPLNRYWARRAKRAFDIVASMTALILLSPLLMPIAIAVKLDGGPALFRQSRIGKDGRPFSCLKFRSMAVDAEERLQRMIASDPKVRAEWEANYKLRNDPRITMIGKFLRKSNIDELPQLINILRGEMSVVGPRPVTEPEIKRYGDAAQAYQRVRPGLTGLWQTNGRNDTSFEERIQLDAWYVRNWSLWRDAVMIARTVREVVFARGI